MLFYSLKKLLYTAGILIVIAMSWLFLFNDNSQIDKKAKLQILQPDSTVEVLREKIIIWHEAVGTVRPVTEAVVSAQATGRIINVNVKEGSIVSKGMLLAKIDSKESEARFEQAKSSLNVAKAEKEQAVSDYKRTKELFKRKTVSKKRMEDAETRKKQAVAIVNSETVQNFVSAT